MYNTVAKHLYLKQIDCHNKSSNPLAPYKVFTMLSTLLCARNNSRYWINPSGNNSLSL